MLTGPQEDMPVPPFISVIMPVRNEARYIRESLAAVLAQDYPPDRIEILVADGSSTDGTREILRSYQQQWPNIILVDNPCRIVPTGMNAALRLARGEVIIRVDGHCRVAPDYVRRCVHHLQVDGVDVVGGPTNTLGETPLAAAIAAAMSASFGVGGSAFRTQKGKTLLVDSVPFPAYTRRLIARVGLYDEELVRNQDDEYSYRIRQAGGRLLLAADVRSTYYSRTSLGSLWRQYYQYGYWKVRVLQKHPRQMQPRQFVPPAFALALMVSLLLAALSLLVPGLRPLAVLPLAALGTAYAAANLAASFWTASRYGWRMLAALPAAFFILHFGYGLGFLVGLLRFSKRWRDRIGHVPVWGTSASSDALQGSPGANLAPQMDM